MLPPSLRDEVLAITYGEILDKIRFFRDCTDADFLWKILPLLKPMKVDRGDILYWYGDHADESKLGGLIMGIVYFVKKGMIKLYTENGNPFIKYGQGDMFGD